MPQEHLSVSHLLVLQVNSELSVKHFQGQDLLSSMSLLTPQGNTFYQSENVSYTAAW